MPTFAERLTESMDSADAAWASMSEDERILRRTKYPDLPVTKPIPTLEEYEARLRKRQERNDHNDRIRALVSAYRAFGYDVDVEYRAEEGLMVYLYATPLEEGIQIKLPPNSFYATKLP